MKKRWRSYMASLLCIVLIGNVLMPEALLYAAVPSVESGEENGSGNMSTPSNADKMSSPSDADKAMKMESEKVTTVLSSDDLDDWKSWDVYGIAPTYVDLGVDDDDWTYFMSSAEFGMSQAVDGFYGKQLLKDPGLAEIYNMLDVFCRQIENGTLEDTTQVWKSENYMVFNIPLDELEIFEGMIKEELIVDQWVCMNAYFWDHPQYRGVSSKFSADVKRNVSGGITGGKITLEIELSCQEPNVLKKELDEINRIVDSVEIRGDHGYEKVKSIHDYICSTISYDLNAKDSHSVYGALTNKKAVCDGYARVFQVFCNKHNIESAVIVGLGQTDGGEYDGHMWNAVCLEDHQWYAVDTTLDQGYEEPNYDFLLVGKSTISPRDGLPFEESHVAEKPNFREGQHYAALDLPWLSEDRYKEPGWITVLCDVWETYDTQSEEFSEFISQFSLSCGSFSWNKKDRATIEERTRFDKFYIEMKCQAYEQLSNASLQVTLPDGFSFSENEIVLKETLQIPSVEKYESFTLPLTVYPIYDQDYTADYLNLGVDVISGGETVETIIAETIPVVKNSLEGHTMFSNDYRSYKTNIVSDYFAEGSYTYNHDLAKLSLALAAMENRKDELIEDSYLNLGFTDVRTYEYKKDENKEAHFKFSIAQKRIILDGKIVTVVAVPMSDNEWLVNPLAIDAAYNELGTIKSTVTTALSDYMESFKLSSDDVKLLLCGHNRGGSVANLMGAEFDRIRTLRSSADNIYTYTFGAPNSTTADEIESSVKDDRLSKDIYINIYNIVDDLDIQPAMPMRDVGDHRKYGTDLVLAHRFLVDYYQRRQKASDLYWTYTGYQYDPIEIHHYIFTFPIVGESIEEYTLRQLDELLGIEVGKIESAGWEAMEKLTVKSNLSQCFIKALKFLMGPIGAAEKMAKYYNNIMTTHSPASYMAWMEISEGEISKEKINNPLRAKRLLIACPVDVEIYDSDGRLVGKIEAGRVDETIEKRVYMMVEGDAKYVFLPGNEDFSVKIIGTGEGTMNYSIVEQDEYGNVTRIVSTSDIDITEGKIFYGNIDNVVETPIENYKLTCNDQSIIMPGKEFLDGNTNVVYVGVSVTGNGGYTQGAGFYEEGEQVHLKAVVDNGLFAGWYCNGQRIWPGEEYSFQCDKDASFEARFTTELIVNNTILDQSVSYYTGSEIRPPVQIFDGNYELIEGKDYQVSYQDNVNVGTGKVIITGIGNYSGTMVRLFDIIEAGRDSWSVMFWSCGGTEMGMQTVVPGQKAVDPGVPLRDGYIFAGWYLGDELYDFERPVMDDILLEAHWQIMQYTITFDSNGGTVVDAQRVYYDSPISEPPVPVREGYAFAGWYNGDSKYDFGIMVTGDMTLTARWTPISGHNPGDGQGGSGSGGNSGSGGSGSSGGGGSSGSGGSGGGGGGSSKGPSSSSNTVSLPDYVVKGGTWTQNAEGKWQYTNGRLYMNEWAAVENPYANIAAGQEAFDWFRFDADGFMTTGWYTDELGDTYYLNPVSDGTLGRMVTGWNFIDQAWHFFTTESNGKRGAMFRSTTSPDGKTVNENGQYTVNGVVQLELSR